jgi:hypothetical protein
MKKRKTVKETDVFWPILSIDFQHDVRNTLPNNDLRRALFLALRSVKQADTLHSLLRRFSARPLSP